MKRNLSILLVAAAMSATAFANGLTLGTTNKGGEGGDGGAGVGVGVAAAVATTEVKTVQGQTSTSVANPNVTITGDTTASNTPPVIGANIPAVPTSCRLYLFGGGATRDGAASGSIPLANDETCLSIAKLNLMERAGGFTQAEKQIVVCKVEGMAELDTCQKLATK